VSCTFLAGATRKRVGQATATDTDTDTASLKELSRNVAPLGFAALESTTIGNRAATRIDLAILEIKSLCNM
jgi:hypothetical protein